MPALTVALICAGSAVAGEIEDAALGRRFAARRGCPACHGQDLGGRVLDDDPVRGRTVAPDLTVGPLARLSDTGFVNLPHVGALTAQERRLLLAWRRTLEPVGRPLPPHAPSLIGRLYRWLGLGNDGERLVAERGCRACHGKRLLGTAASRLRPAAPGLRTLSARGWDVAAFRTALRHGRRRDGTELDPAMPRGLAAGLTDGEIEAMWEALVRP